jgi:hypothetical protein
MTLTPVKPLLSNIFENFRNNLKWPPWYTQGPGARKLIHEKKTDVENLVSDSL